MAITVYGVALASFALLQGLSPNGKLYWLRTPRMGGWIYGPYVSHNNYAGLMEMLVPIPLIFCLTRYAQGHMRTVIAAGAALMAGTIFLSGSRGGMISFVAEMILFGCRAHPHAEGSQGCCRRWRFRGRHDRLAFVDWRR